MRDHKYSLRKRRSLSQSDDANTSSSSNHSSTTLERNGFDLEKSVHITQDSLFSGSSGWKDYRGFFNLSILLLFVSNGRLALENLIKYGVLVSPTSWIYFHLTDPWWKWPNLAMVLMSNISIFIVFVVEKLMVIRKLKVRSSALQKESLLIYPHNLTLQNLYYFIFAPTLCYELQFPRTNGRRKSFIMKRTAEFVCLTLIIIALCQQWVAPLLRNSVEPFTTMNFSLCIERVLKLAVPNHIIWLIFFYTIFHSLLNLIAELTEFADRQFYLDFWNAETLAVFWKTWNIPVHRWALRHIYWPMVFNGFSKMNAACAVFFVSAFFHEYLVNDIHICKVFLLFFSLELMQNQNPKEIDISEINRRKSLINLYIIQVSVPLHMFRFWAYLCMMAQIPLSIFTEKVLKGGRPGNIAMWLSLILGQPLCILMYVHDWYVVHYPHSLEYVDAYGNSTMQF
ncbi:MBOAT family protein [Onchocerca flexuosa]|uniref:O-acyltransferase n=1 Tax=Onchocerca flexuosa TaxID=387005 RepID=A0A238BWY2_9BILA|nr:MBOAT family protein [Onchocerca flexuosa]